MSRRLIRETVGMFLIAIVVSPAWSQGVNVKPGALEHIFALQRQIQDLHPAFVHVYPIAIVQDQKFYVYEPDAAAQSYRLATTAPDKFNVPAGVRAAMPLDFWNNRIACVVTPEVFEKPAGYAMIFHEFVHCCQWESCEMRLKESLRVYRKALEKKDYMWELQYRFPYADSQFRHEYEAMLKAIRGDDPERAVSIRKALKARLSQEDREYMTWQEWKEGLARYLENLVAARLGLPENHGGLGPPFTRVGFYAGGEAFIRMLVKQDPAAANDIEALFRRIANQMRERGKSDQSKEVSRYEELSVLRSGHRTVHVADSGCFFPAGTCLLGCGRQNPGRGIQALADHGLCRVHVGRARPASHRFAARETGTAVGQR